MGHRTAYFIIEAVLATLLILVTGTLSYAGNQEISMAPVNPELLDFLESQAQEGLAKITSMGDAKSCSLVPSPLIPVVHQVSSLTLTKSAALDSVYDMRDPDNDPGTNDSLLTEIKDQGRRNTCWAFATYGGLESQLIQDLDEDEDFSEDNLAFHHGFDWGPDEGGNVDMSTAYLSRFSGPVSEADDRYDEVSEDVDLAPSRYIDNVVFLPVRSASLDNSYIKEAVMAHGGIYSSLYYDDAYLASDNTYYYTGSSMNTNHAIVIVGWDDTKSVSGAPGPGVFIVRNSWGKTWGDNGYFYVSYYDPLIGYSTLTYFDDKEDSDLGVNKVYYYDELGATGFIGYGDGTAYGANWFVPEENGDLNAVGFYAVTGMSYEITVYDTHSGSSFSNVLTTQTGAVAYGGWHTITLDTKVSYTAEDGFGIAVKFMSTDPETNYPIPMESRIPEYSSNAVSNEGESYYSYNGTHWTDASADGRGNVCIKALCRESSSGDMDEDGDVDGEDVYRFSQSFSVENPDLEGLQELSENFGRMF